MAIEARPLSILVVDDNEDAGESLAAILNLEGFHASYATSTEKAMSEPWPDIALIDLRMPRLSGYDLARFLKIEGRGRRPILIALTGCGTLEDFEKSKAEGFDFHLVKPVDPALFVGIVKRVEKTLQ